MQVREERKRKKEEKLKKDLEEREKINNKPSVNEIIHRQEIRKPVKNQGVFLHDSEGLIKALFQIPALCLLHRWKQWRVVGCWSHGDRDTGMDV